MKARNLLKILRDLGCLEIRQNGSHLRVQCRHCLSTIPMHGADDLKFGTLKQIQRDLEPCLGKKWLKI